MADILVVKKLAVSHFFNRNFEGFSMKQKKTPMRKSLVSNEQFPKKDLLRIAYNKEGEISIDPSGKAHGRGAYIAILNKEAREAKKKRVFDRAFKLKLLMSSMMS